MTIFLVFLQSCSRYSVSINDNVFYTPPDLLSEYAVEDSHLHTCLKNTIAESHITSVKQLVKLQCPSGNIVDLSGIEQFTNLKHIDLKSNKIQNIEPIRQLKSLSRLNVSDNQIRDFSPLALLVNLELAELHGNINADCQTLRRSISTQTVRVAMPTHCLGEPASSN